MTQPRIRHALRRDAHEGEAIKRLQLAGFEVVPLKLADGAPDLALTPRHGGCVRGWLLMELKSTDGRLTPAQRRWWARYGHLSAALCRPGEEVAAAQAWLRGEPLTRWWPPMLFGSSGFKGRRSRSGASRLSPALVRPGGAPC